MLIMRDLIGSKGSSMRSLLLPKLFAVLTVLALTAVACGGGDDGAQVRGIGADDADAESVSASASGSGSASGSASASAVSVDEEAMENTTGDGGYD